VNMHDNFTRLMSLALDDEATLGEQAQLQAHLRTCAVCSSVWDAWKEADRVLSHAPQVAPPAELLVGISERLGAYEAGRRRLRWVGAGLLAIWVATALVAFWVAVGVGVSRIGWAEVMDAVLWPLAQMLQGLLWTLRGSGFSRRASGARASRSAWACAWCWRAP